MTTTEQNAPQIDQKTLEAYQAQALETLRETSRKLDVEVSKAVYPFGGTVAVAGIGYLQLSTVTPMEFTNGVKLTYLGKGGGLVFGGGAYAGGGAFTRDPASLVGKEVAFVLGGGGGLLYVTWILDGVLIGEGVFAGISVFAGSGGGSGPFQRA